MLKNKKENEKTEDIIVMGLEKKQTPRRKEEEIDDGYERNIIKD